MRFEDHVVVVTGGASGIGLATARQLLDAGAKVALLDVNPHSLEVAEKTLAAGSERVLTAAVDAADTAAMTEAFGRVEKDLGSVTDLVAAAGIRMKSVPVTDLSDEVWDNVIRVNLRGVFVACRAAAKLLKPRKSGAIVTVSSLNGYVARIDQTAYSASKAGVSHLSNALALELAEFGIRVNNVCPGSIDTPMLRMASDQDGAQILHDRIYGSSTRFRAGIPLRKIGEAEDVAEAILYLLGAKHITGQTIYVDGGESLI